MTDVDATARRVDAERRARRVMTTRTTRGNVDASDGDGSARATMEFAREAIGSDRASEGGSDGSAARRRESAFAPNVRRSVVKVTTGGERGSGGTEGGTGGGAARPASRLGRSRADGGTREGRKTSRLAGRVDDGAGSRLRTAREGGGAPARPRTPTERAAGGETSPSPARAATPLGFRSPAPSRTSKQLVPAVGRMEPKPAAVAVVSPLALPVGTAPDLLASPGALALAAPPPVMPVPAHRWVRSAGSTRGGRVGEGSRRDLLEASTSYDNDPAMTIRDIIRQKTAEERANEARTRVLKRSKSKKPMPDFGRKKAVEPAAPALPELASLPPRPAVMAPQVQVIDGNIVINPQSLTVSAAAEKDAGLSDFKRVEENGTRLNSSTYMNRAKAEKWSKDDTELFYRAMTQFGTDFSLIARLFPGRTRRQVKRKYLIEDRADPRRVERCISNRETDPAIYKSLIAVLQAQAAEADLARSNIDARVILDGDAAEEAPEPSANEEIPPKDEPAKEETVSKVGRGKKSARTA